MVLAGSEMGWGGLAWGPVEEAAAEDVEVEVLHGLAAILAGVGYDAVSAGECAVGKRGGGVGEVAEHLDGGLLDIGEVLPGDDEQMGGGLRVDVGEGDAFVVFVDGLDGDLAGGDFAEKAVWIGRR